MTATFHGVRGSTPCHGSDIVRYGGNTSCVSLQIPGADPILLDLGTGLRYFGAMQPIGKPFRGTCLLSHLHWDHIQGLPFFAPLLTHGAEVKIHAPSQDDGTTVEKVFGDTIRPPLFPIHLAMLPGKISYSEVGDSEFVIDGAGAGDIHVMSRVIPHVGRTVGYRIDWNGVSIAYISDHQQPCDGSLVASEGALELCRGVDVLIHDAQYTPEEFARKCDWGHCTVDFAVWLAAEAGVERLALFHHDPAHDDDMMDRIVSEAVVAGKAMGVDVFGAAEGITIAVGS